MDSTQLPDIVVTRSTSETTPAHYVLDKKSSWSSYLSSWTSSLGIERPEAKKPSTVPTSRQIDSISSFKNPWPSFHKPTAQEMWKSLVFGNDEDTSLQLAASHVPGTSLTDTSKATRDKQAAALLRVETPDFSFDAEKHISKSTWLGHAGMLLQLRPLQAGNRPIRIIFDPIFSMRCSPSQSLGPIRSYLPPCKIEDLPAIDLMLLSHNHYDHLDYETVANLWRLHSSTIRFIVPLKNKQWFKECGIPADRIEELDWWESATISGTGAEDNRLKITCTPAQHSSGRDGGDENATLWSSWYLDHKTSDADSYKIFFGGDSGYQFHGDPSWPSKPPRMSSSSDPNQALTSKVKRPQSSRSQSRDSSKDADDYPPCPAFKEIATRLGPPHLLYLPLALGATWAYLRSFFSDYLPDSLDPFPRHSSGVTGSIHMPPWDAVRVLKEMTESLSTNSSTNAPVAIGMHWGTFVTDQTEVLKTLGQLEWACDQQEIRFLRQLETGTTGGAKKGSFLALNHGQSVST